MDDLLLAAVTFLTVVVLVDLLVTLRVARWVRERSEERLRYMQGSHELVTGTPAPDFWATTLAGEPVRLKDFAGRSVALVFTSPTCDICRAELPALHDLARLAMASEGVEMALVSDADATATSLWLDTVRRADGFDVTLPVLVATRDSDFLHEYNPNGGVPYFCLIDEDGLVRARSLLVEPEFRHFEQLWAGAIAR